MQGEGRLATLRARSVDLATAIAAGRRRIAALEAGELDDPRIHLQHAAEPQPPAETQRRVVAETWAALSVGLLIASLAIIIWFRILPPGVAVLAMFGSYLAIEAFFKRDVRILFLRLSLVVAFITVVILAVTFLREVLLLGLLGLGVLLIVDNLGEVRRRLR